jgi:prevent-host-death family protein
MHVETNDMVSVTEASQGLSKLVNAVSPEKRFVVMRNNKPAAVIADVETMERLQRIDELEDDVRLLSVAWVRSLTDTGRRYTLDEVATEFGIDLDED